MTRTHTPKVPEAQRRRRWLPLLLIPTVLLSAGLLCADALRRNAPVATPAEISLPSVELWNRPLESLTAPSGPLIETVAVSEQVIAPDHVPDSAEPAAASEPVFEEANGNSNGNGNGNGNANGNGGVGNGNGVGNGKH